MDKYKITPILALSLGILLGTSLRIADGKPKEIKVQIHTVKGSDITEAQIRGWIEKANQIDANYAKFIVDSNHVYEPNTPYDPSKNDDGKVNIWGLRYCVVTGEPNYVSGQKGGIIEVVPGKKGADGTDVFIKDSTLAHELNHFLMGPAHSDDPNNKMYPDNQQDANGVRTSCHRKGTQLTTDQKDKILASLSGTANDAVASGHGAEAYDNIGDVSVGYIDLDWTQGWIQWLHGMEIFHLTAQVSHLSFNPTPSSELGFYIDSDNNRLTGQPPEGLDYYVAFSPAFSQIIFKRYINGQWIQLNPAGISYELTYIDKDASDASIPAGVQITLPMTLLGSTGNVINYKTVASTSPPTQTDYSPNTGMLTIQIPPKPVPGDLNIDYKVDVNDLEIMVEDWLKTGTSLADIYPPDAGDNIVDFRDFAVLANDWLLGL